MHENTKYIEHICLPLSQVSMAGNQAGYAMVLIEISMDCKYL